MVHMSDVNGGTAGPGPGARSQTFPSDSNGAGGFRPSGPAGKRLERKRHGRWIAGVCAGLGGYFGLDPTVIRVVTLVLVLFGGLGPLAYVIAWVLMPEEGDPVSIAERLINSTDGRPGPG
jgi:phage shock protein PspC (stress-responsive transcriptional regulator)